MMLVSRDSVLRLLTIVAIAIVVYAFSSVLHEGVGHGLACVFIHGTPVTISSDNFVCHAVPNVPWNLQILTAAGTVVNILFGFGGWVLLRKFKNISVQSSYFLWLFTIVNLLQAGGYLLFSPLAGFGDWTLFVSNLNYQLVWKVGLTVLGAGLSYVGLIIGTREFAYFLTGSKEQKLQIAKNLILLPYTVGGVVSCLAALFHSGGLFSAIAASFGGTAWMLLIFKKVKKIPTSSSISFLLPVNWLWIVLGSVMLVLYVVVLGLKISFN